MCLVSTQQTAAGFPVTLVIPLVKFLVVLKTCIGLLTTDRKPDYLVSAKHRELAVNHSSQTWSKRITMRASTSNRLVGHRREQGSVHVRRHLMSSTFTCMWALSEHIVLLLPGNQVVRLHWYKQGVVMVYVILSSVFQALSVIRIFFIISDS